MDELEKECLCEGLTPKDKKNIEKGDQGHFKDSLINLSPSELMALIGLTHPELENMSPARLVYLRKDIEKTKEEELNALDQDERKRMNRQE